MYSCINFFVSNIKFYFVFTRELIHPFTNSYKKFIYYHFYWSINLYNCKMVSVHALILSKSLYSKGRNFFILLKIIRSGIWGHLDPKPLSFTNKSKSYKKNCWGVCGRSMYQRKKSICFCSWVLPTLIILGGTNPGTYPENLIPLGLCNKSKPIFCRSYILLLNKIVSTPNSLSADLETHIWEYSAWKPLNIAQNIKSCQDFNYFRHSNP